MDPSKLPVVLRQDAPVWLSVPAAFEKCLSGCPPVVHHQQDERLLGAWPQERGVAACGARPLVFLLRLKPGRERKTPSHKVSHLKVERASVPPPPSPLVKSQQRKSQPVHVGAESPTRHVVGDIIVGRSCLPRQRH